MWPLLWCCLIIMHPSGWWPERSCHRNFSHRIFISTVICHCVLPGCHYLSTCCSKKRWLQRDTISAFFLPTMIARCCSEKQWINNSHTTFWPILVVYSAKLWWGKYHVPWESQARLDGLSNVHWRPENSKALSVRVRRIKFLHLEAFHGRTLMLLATQKTNHEGLQQY